MNHETSAIILKALDGLSARAVATAENIANAGTPNYRPLRVSFEGALKEAAAEGPEAIAQLQFKAEPAPAGTPLRVDLEMATASTTALRYEALVSLLDRQSQALSSLLRGNV